MSGKNTERKTAGNSTFTIGGVSCYADSFVVADSLVLRNRQLLVAGKGYIIL